MSVKYVISYYYKAYCMMIRRPDIFQMSFNTKVTSLLCVLALTGSNLQKPCDERKFSWETPLDLVSLSVVLRGNPLLHPSEVVLIREL